MFQTIAGLDVYVVDLKSIPQLPIINDDLELLPYAIALNNAIEGGLVKEPGKYAIHIDPKGQSWSIFAIQE